MAGPGSVKVFRQNVYKRLAEAFFNLEWLLSNRPKTFDAEEAKLYLDVVSRLRKHQGSLPSYLTRHERRLKTAMSKRVG